MMLPALFALLASLLAIGLYKLAARLGRAEVVEHSQPERAQVYFDMRRHAAQVSVAWLDAGTASILPGPIELACILAQDFSANVRVVNRSAFLLASSLHPRELGAGVNLAYRVFTVPPAAAGEPPQLLYESSRHLLRPSLLPISWAVNAHADVSLSMRCPRQAGSYRLQVELVQDGVAWQSDRHPQGTYAVAHLRADPSPLPASADPALQAPGVDSALADPSADPALQALGVDSALADPSANPALQAPSADR